MIERKPLNDCPVCGSSLKVQVLHCTSCNTKIEGNFEPPKSNIFTLSSKDLEFVELFVRVRGSIKEMEKALGISYPTVRGLLDNIIKKMGYPVRKKMDQKIRLDIISRLEKGDITPEKAIQLLADENEDE